MLNRPGANTNLATQAVVRSRPDGYTLLIASFGLSMVIRESIRHVFPNGSNPQPFPTLVDARIRIPGGAEVPAFSVFVLLSSVVVVALLFVLLRHTPLGLRIRAVSQDRKIK